MILISAAGGRLGFYYKDFEILPPLPGKLTSLLAFEFKKLICICECVVLCSRIFQLIFIKTIRLVILSKK